MTELQLPQITVTLSTEAVFVSFLCGAQVGSRIKEGRSLRHFLKEGLPNFTQIVKHFSFEYLSVNITQHMKNFIQ